MTIVACFLQKGKRLLPGVLTAPKRCVMLEKLKKGVSLMEQFGIALLAVAVIGIPLAIMTFTNSDTKRGCGGGCATCGNREFCHRKTKKKAP